MHKGYKKTVTILITCALIGALLCLPVSAVTPVTIGNLTVDDYSFRTWTGAGYQEASSTTAVDITVSSSEQFMFHVAMMNPADYFGGNSSYYRCLNMLFELPYSDYQRTLSFRVSPKYYDVTGYDIGDGGYDISLGDLTYAHGGVLGDIEYSSVRDGKDIIITINCENYDSIRFQVASLCYVDWTSLSFTFSEFKLISDTGTQDIIDNQNQNAQDIQDNQDKNTQSIIDNQNELAEQEKQEIQDSGNQATDAAENIPDKSAGFIEALGTFVGAMSTTSTECSLKFPGIKVPAIEGFFPETELIGEQDIDISQAIGLIPDEIMKLIQALTTIGLIVFCFKELYDTVSEALTRKRASDE